MIGGIVFENSRSIDPSGSYLGSSIVCHLENHISSSLRIEDLGGIFSLREDDNAGCAVQDRKATTSDCLPVPLTWNR